MFLYSSPPSRHVKANASPDGRRWQLAKRGGTKRVGTARGEVVVVVKTKRRGSTSAASAQASSGAYGLVVFPPSLIPPSSLVSGPSTARHPSPFKRQSKMSPPWIRCQCVPRGGEYSATVPSPKIPLLTSKKDPYYSHEDTAKLCARFVTHLFACPDLPPLSTTVPPAPSPPLANFIAYARHRTRLHTSVTFAALYLLQRLKARFLTARSSSGHR